MCTICLIQSSAYFKVTCFKIVSVFLLFPELRRFRVFNKVSCIWHEMGALVSGPKQPHGELCITYTRGTEVMHIGSTVEIQTRMREKITQQCLTRGLPPPVFKGAIADCPSWFPKRQSPTAPVGFLE